MHNKIMGLPKSSKTACRFSVIQLTLEYLRSSFKQSNHFGFTHDIGSIGK